MEQLIILILVWLCNIASIIQTVMNGKTKLLLVTIPLHIIGIAFAIWYTVLVLQ